MDYPHAYLPNMLEVGGLHLLEPSQLQVPTVSRDGVQRLLKMIDFYYRFQHVRSFIESAPGGVIYMSLGAEVQTALLPSDKLSILLDIFTHLKEFHFLLKWETEKFVQQLPENIMINSWWPQQAILGEYSGTYSGSKSKVLSASLPCSTSAGEALHQQLRSAKCLGVDCGKHAHPCHTHTGRAGGAGQASAAKWCGSYSAVRCHCL